MKEARKDPSVDSTPPSVSNHPASVSSAPRARPGANDPMVGAVINEKYRVVSVLATGGMGRIYTAEQLPLGRMVALKVILPTLADSWMTRTPAGSRSGVAFFARPASSRSSSTPTS
jgi:serine/threonine protein kinase